jgi:hypothetical protein
MRILRPVIGAQALFMPTREADGPQRRPIGSEYVRDNHERGKSLLLKQLSQQFQRGGLVVPSLNQNVENFAFAIDGPPHIHSLAANRDEMPSIVGPRLAQLRHRNVGRKDNTLHAAAISAPDDGPW